MGFSRQSTGVGCHCLLWGSPREVGKKEKKIILQDMSFGICLAVQ